MGGIWCSFFGVGRGGREEAPRIFDLRFAIFEQKAKQGSLTFESDDAALRR
jgi:hypothetical protein